MHTYFQKLFVIWITCLTFIILVLLLSSVLKNYAFFSLSFNFRKAQIEKFGVSGFKTQNDKSWLLQKRMFYDLKFGQYANCMECSGLSVSTGNMVK